MIKPGISLPWTYYCLYWEMPLPFILSPALLALPAIWFHILGQKCSFVFLSSVFSTFIRVNLIPNVTLKKIGYFFNGSQCLCCVLFWLIIVDTTAVRYGRPALRVRTVRPAGPAATEWLRQSNPVSPISSGFPELAPYSTHTAGKSDLPRNLIVSQLCNVTFALCIV